MVFVNTKRAALRGTAKKHAEPKGKYVTQNQLNRALAVNTGNRRHNNYQIDNLYTTTSIYSKILGNGINKGPDLGERQGDHINAIRWNMKFKFENTDAFFSMKMRIVVAEINRPTENVTAELFAPQGSTNTPIDFDGTAGTVAARKLYDILPLNPDKFSKIYYDKVIDLAIDGSETSTGYMKNFRTHNISIPFGGKRISYTTNAAVDNAIYPQVKMFWFVVHNNGADATPVKGSYQSTLYYKT